MSDQTSQDQGSGWGLFWYFAIGTVAVVFLLLMVGIGVRVLSGLGASGLAWMTFAGGGFIAVVIVMILGAISYKAMGAHDRTQALGMPKGSVRSLLMFLVFSLLGVFVFFSVDSIGDRHVRSTIIVPDGETIDVIIGQLGEVDIISIGPGEKIEQGRGDDTVLITTTKIEFERIRPTSEDVKDLVNQIAIAIFSMASSIIGFYFGTRSQVPAFGSSRDSGVPAVSGTLPPGETDSPDWSLGAGQISLTRNDGVYIGEVEFASTELPDEHAFTGLIVPPLNDRAKYEAFDVTVSRNGQFLSIEITGPDTPALAGATLSLYPVNHDDVALAVEIV